MDYHFDFATIYNQMPDFENHEEAAAWFHEKFPDRFLLKDSDMVEGTRVFYYHIVKDPRAYYEYMENLTDGINEEIITTEPFESYSTVEISEDGGISFSI